MATPWWERHPGRLEDELARLQAAGVAFTLDEEAKAEGLLRLAITVDVPELGSVALIVTFPDLYPYVRPEVAAPELSLPHHQHPFGKTLCLIGRSSRNWGTGDTLAWLLTEQLPGALRAGAAEGVARPITEALDEERQAEPFSDYYTYAPAAMLLIDGEWSLPAEETSGDLFIAVDGALPPSADPQQHTAGAVLEVHGRDGTVLAAAADGLRRRYPEPVRARWSRLQAPVLLDDPRAVWEAAEAADTGVGGRRRRTRGTLAHPVEIRAVVFPEEVAWRSSGDGWMFVMRQVGESITPSPSKKQKGRGRGRPRHAPEKHWLVRAGRAGPQDLAARVPELVGLSDRTVLVAGVGALGSTVADHLARAGVGRLHLLDRDVLEPGNQIRHAGFFRQCGLPKAVASAQVALDRSPYLDAKFTVMNLGGVRRGPDSADETDVLESLLCGVNLLVDATAELGLQHLLADLAAAARLPYVAVSATNGAWGGMVIRIEPDGDACYTCLGHLLADGSIVLPPASPSELVQPPGCANPTFTGSGFDLDHVALQAVRVVVGELCVVGNHYPRAPDDVAVLALRQPDGTPTLPTWTGYPLTRHRSCLAH